MDNIETEIKELERAAQSAQLEADKFLELAATMRASAVIMSLPPLEAITVLRYGRCLCLKTGNKETARQLLKHFGGTWDKEFDNTSGKFFFSCREEIASLRIKIETDPSPTCKIKKVEREVKYTEIRYEPEGDCGSILDDTSSASVE